MKKQKTISTFKLNKVVALFDSILELTPGISTDLTIFLEEKKLNKKQWELLRTLDTGCQAWIRTKKGIDISNDIKIFIG